MSIIQANDLTIYYEISGNGPPLVLLPGLLGTVENDWRRFIPALSKNYRTIAVDLRGHGRTDNPSPSGGTGPGELNLNQMADDLNNFLDKLGIENASVLGYSLGGCLGLIAGLKRPGHINALIMHATKFFWNEDSVSSMSTANDPKVVLEKSPRYAQALQKSHSAVYGDNYWQQLLSIATRFVKTMPENGPTLKQAANADFPILVSVGDHDQLIALEEAILLLRSLIKGELLVLPHTRHPIKSVPLDTFIVVVQEFLERALNPKNEERRSI